MLGSSLIIKNRPCSAPFREGFLARGSTCSPPTAVGGMGKAPPGGASSRRAAARSSMPRARLRQRMPRRRLWGHPHLPKGCCGRSLRQPAVGTRTGRSTGLACGGRCSLPAAPDTGTSAAAAGTLRCSSGAYAEVRPFLGWRAGLTSWIDGARSSVAIRRSRGAAKTAMAAVSILPSPCRSAGSEASQAIARVLDPPVRPARALRFSDDILAQPMCACGACRRSCGAGSGSDSRYHLQAPRHSKRPSVASPPTARSVGAPAPNLHSSAAARRRRSWSPTDGFLYCLPLRCMGRIRKPADLT